MIKQADIVIIGGGVVGCSIAYNLAKAGAGKVAVIERAYLASGATGRCGAGVRMQWGSKTNCLLSRESVKILENLPAILEEKDDIEFNQSGYLLLAYTDKMVDQFKKNLVLQNSLDIPARWTTPSEAKEIVPQLNIEGLLGATFCGKDGHANPFKVTSLYAKAARRLGVEFYTYTEVTDITVKSGKITTVHTTKGDIDTNTVINAAGGYAKVVGRMAGVELPIFPERHEILVTEPVEPMHMPMVMCFYHNLYCQQTPHGSFIMGIGHPNEPETFTIKSSLSFLPEMARRITKILPPLKNLNVIRQWAGLYDMCPDRTPILGEDSALKGFYIAAGFSGHGFMISPIVGKLMAQTIMGSPTDIPITMFSAERFALNQLYIEPSVV
ncbi:NAD(P)/FAD-dependent oxidoreductase [Sporomusa acidovorans]|uniref:Sarcosine oxidase subunit beta n=1 Tax=Sporomusa acidovorans (strain ATCC 49682 / DSM 3132 / Mol) TaxID=1123286 RepID=A0ABZ3J301_SPOA4|nr:FAD-binding oxidoreductase [Sporomusa acidovorans]OZC20253.1 sarcosine oxidase subunit beta [Sporomusa acidovorans DSM 3132]SDD40468.1 sarcosine oxidase subunit beta [Sporomusa acidovorans]